MKVMIIDYGMGNLGSVKRAIEESGINNVVISNDKRDFQTSTHFVLPGVGAYPVAMNNIKKNGLDDFIREVAIKEKLPFLGICLGMQLLVEKSEEMGINRGLGLIEGEVILFKPKDHERVPHIGWNEIIKRKDHPVLKGIDNKSDFYFVHSYVVSGVKDENNLTVTPYCGDFTSMIVKENIIGTQFHPEKSSTHGFQLLKNFLAL